MATRPVDEGAMVDTGAALASLYQGPLAEFIARRRTLVTQLKASGHKDVATRLGTAAKPSRAAHLVNQVFWRARPVYDAVLEAGTAARAAQQARLLGDGEATDLPHTMHLRDQAVRAAVDEALTVAASEGMGVGESLAGPVRASFEALAAHGREGRLPHGQLVEDVPLPGLQALAGLVLPAGTPPVRRFEIVARQAPAEPVEPVVPDPRRLDAEARVADAREREALARERRVELERALEAAARLLGDAEREFEAARVRVASATQAVEAGRTALDGAVKEAEHRQQVLAEAEATLASFEESR